MKHRLLKLGVFLLLGAIVNVAVAWGCALWSPVKIVVRDASGFVYAGAGIGFRLDPYQDGDTAAVRSRCGFPAHVFTCNVLNTNPTTFVNAASMPEWLPVAEPARRRAPAMPLWSGMAINTILYATILWSLLTVTGEIRRLARVRRGCCPACGHIIAAGTCANGLCSECASPLPKGFKPKPEVSAKT